MPRPGLFIYSRHGGLSSKLMISLKNYNSDFHLEGRGKCNPKYQNSIHTKLTFNKCTDLRHK